MIHAVPPPPPIVWYYPEVRVKSVATTTKLLGWPHYASLYEQVELSGVMVNYTYLDQSESVQYVHCFPVKVSSAARWRCQVQGSIDFVEKTLVVVNKKGKIKFRVTYSSRKREGRPR